MKCDELAERMPWYLNGSLGPEEASEIQDHLTWCDTCRHHFDQTRLAWIIHEGHVPSHVLVSLAAGDAFSPTEQESIEEHLRGCASCSEELALVQSSLAIGNESSQPVAPPLPYLPLPRRGVPLWSLAATLLIGLGMGSWWQAQRSSPDSLGSPTQLLELFPQTQTQRGHDPKTPKVVLSSRLDSVTLIFNSTLDAQYRLLELKILDSEQRLLWQGSSLERADDGSLALTLPRNMFARGGTFTATLSPSEAPILLEPYRFEWMPEPP